MPWVPSPSLATQQNYLDLLADGIEEDIGVIDFFSAFFFFFSLSLGLLSPIITTSNRSLT